MTGKPVGRVRQPRDLPRKGVRVELNERDEALLAALARFGIARTGDLVTLVFAGTRPDTAARRLRRLLDAGYLNAEVADRAKENVYQLGPGGRRWAADRGVKETRPPRSERAHHLAVVRTWVELARTCHDITGVEMTRVTPEWELRARPEAAAYPAMPDAMFEMTVALAPPPPAIVRMAVEVDLSSERSPILRRKVTNYRRLLGAEEGLWGWTEFGLAFVVSGWSDQRRQGLAEMLGATWPGWWVLWELEAGPSAALAELLGALGHPLTASPGRKGRGGRVTAGDFTGSSRAGGGL